MIVAEIEYKKLGEVWYKVIDDETMEDVSQELSSALDLIEELRNELDNWDEDFREDECQ